MWRDTAESGRMELMFEMMNELLKEQYGLQVLKAEKSKIGAGSDTWFVICADGRYVVKYPAQSEINHPEQEPELCEFLLDRGIPVCRFLKNREGNYLSTDAAGRQFHVQHFIEGKTYELNTAPGWLLKESAGMLGKIHSVLWDYEGLPEGIGKAFIQYMTPQNAIHSYRNSLEVAERQGEKELAEELQYRIGLMQRFPKYEFEIDRLTCLPTHGDYFLSQLICREDRINAVIDWTTACVHPVIWEITRSFVYAAPSCAGGQLDLQEFSEYVAEYCRYAELNAYDREMLLPLFFYQIAVCDYYGQYFSSDVDNRHIYLHQARFSTKLLRWFESSYLV